MLIRKSISDFSGMVFDQDRDRDFDLEIADQFENRLPIQPHTIISLPTPFGGRSGSGGGIAMIIKLFRSTMDA